MRRVNQTTLVMADGASCRHQIHNGSEREALYVVRVLAMSLAHADTDSTTSPATKDVIIR